MIVGGRPKEIYSADIINNANHIVENMYYLYLPVYMEGQDLSLPRNLEFLYDLVISTQSYMEGKCYLDSFYKKRKYIYVSVEYKVVAKGTYQKRPGWHVDGYDTDDLNFIYVDHPDTTEYIDVDEHVTDCSCGESMTYFDSASENNLIKKINQKSLYFLGGAIHRTPLITVDGKERLFVKISHSNHKYNLLGNSINYNLDYHWIYHSREFARNHPSRNDRDFYEG